MRGSWCQVQATVPWTALAAERIRRRYEELPERAASLLARTQVQQRRGRAAQRRARRAAPAGTGGGKTGACDMRAAGTKEGKTSAGRAAGESVAAAMQAAIGLLTASLDSPELEARALPVLIPKDADGLADLMAGLHLISELLIHELYEATGESPQAILQRLAILAEHRRGMPSAG
jgi:hypothetical protein